MSGDLFGRAANTWAGEGTGAVGGAAGQMSGDDSVGRGAGAGRDGAGGDEDENIASLCVWCHLHGVHEGRIAAEPPASKIRRRIGRRGTLWVEGRTRAGAANAAC